MLTLCLLFTYIPKNDQISFIYNRLIMEWTLIYANKDESLDAESVWCGMTTRIAHPLRPIYTDSTVTLRDCDITPTYDLSYLYNYWNQRRTPTIQVISEFSYQIPGTECLNGLWPSSLHSDITIVVGTEQFKVHKAILALTSDYFSELFQAMAPDRPNKIIIHSKDSVIFRKITDLIYGYKVIVDDIEGLRFLSMATKEINERIRHTLASTIRLKDQKDIYEYATLADYMYDGDIWSIFNAFSDYVPKVPAVVKDSANSDFLKKLPYSFRKAYLETYDPAELLDEDGKQITLFVDSDSN